MPETKQHAEKRFDMYYLCEDLEFAARRPGEECQEKKEQIICDWKIMSGQLCRGCCLWTLRVHSAYIAAEYAWHIYRGDPMPWMFGADRAAAELHWHACETIRYAVKRGYCKAPHWLNAGERK